MILAEHRSPRLNYIAGWLGERLFGSALKVVTHEADCPSMMPLLNYSGRETRMTSFAIPPCGLLSENAIGERDLQITGKAEEARFFPTGGDMGFDLFSAAFYLLSRYEEYLPHSLDEYGRFYYKDSIAWKGGFLKFPLLDIWLKNLKQQLLAFWPDLKFMPRDFTCQPSFDLDMAWAIRNKPHWVQTASLAKSFLTGRIRQFNDRYSALLGFQQDEFDVFDDLIELHRSLEQDPIFFILAAARKAGYDRNISAENKEFIMLQVQLSKQVKTGMHLSWAASRDVDLMHQEQEYFRTTLGEKALRRNRMHYLNFSLPNTFRQLQALPVPVQQDFSMGYGNINGFRASTSHPFYWYDLQKETITSLELIPFCWMDANAIFEQKNSLAEAAAELQFFHDTLKNCGGHLVTIGHNHMMGRDKAGREWWKMYAEFYRKNFGANGTYS